MKTQTPAATGKSRKTKPLTVTLSPKLSRRIRRLAKTGMRPAAVVDLFLTGGLIHSTQELRIARRQYRARMAMEGRVGA
jgi:hypothetical protein